MQAEDVNTNQVDKKAQRKGKEEAMEKDGKGKEEGRREREIHQSPIFYLMF